MQQSLLYLPLGAYAKVRRPAYSPHAVFQDCKRLAIGFVELTRVENNIMSVPERWLVAADSAAIAFNFLDCALQTLLDPPKFLHTHDRAYLALKKSSTCGLHRVSY